MCAPVPGSFSSLKWLLLAAFWVLSWALASQSQFSYILLGNTEREISPNLFMETCNRLNKQPGFLNQEDLSGILNILFSLSVYV